MKFSRLLFLISITVLISSCSSSKKLNKINNTSFSGLRFINEYAFPNGTQLNSTTIGGLSGIDYDPKRNVYYMICDDPSSKGSARFYTAQITISEKGIDTVLINDVTILKDAKGQPYPDINKDRSHSADLEAMRYDPTRDEMIWSSEGQRFLRGEKPELQDPAVVIIDKNGNYKDSFELPANMHIQLVEKGPRHNSVFEGLSFDEDYSHLYVSVEEPLYEDGPKAGTGDSTSWVRFLKFDRTTKKQVAQYAYQISSIPYPAVPPGAFKVNGVDDILYLGNDQFIVIERAYSTGRVPSDVRVYLADAKNAEDISGTASLKINPVKRPIRKKLLIDLNNSLNRYIDNIEGVTFGPLLPNNHRTLIFVSDNNFDAKQKNQFLLYEVLP
ncbi:MAG: esterase-like activity of phytase family protein [Chitinophagaceae bacterium]